MQNNGFSKNANSTYFACAIRTLNKHCLATIGVCVFRALASVSALFIFKEKKMDLFLLASSVSSRKSTIALVTVLTISVVSWLVVFIMVIGIATQSLTENKGKLTKRQRLQKQAEEELLAKNIEYLRDFFQMFRNYLRAKYLQSDEACVTFLRHYLRQSAMLQTPMDSPYRLISRSDDFIVICNEKTGMIFGHAASALAAVPACTFEEFLAYAVPEIAAKHPELAGGKTMEELRISEDETDGGKANFYVIAPLSELLYYNKQTELHFDKNSTIPSPLKCIGEQAERLQTIFPEKRR